MRRCHTARAAKPSAPRCRGQRVASAGEDEEKQRAVALQRKAAEHASRRAVHDIDVLIARPVSGCPRTRRPHSPAASQSAPRGRKRGGGHSECNPSAPITRSKRRSPPGSCTRTRRHPTVPPGRDFVLEHRISIVVLDALENETRKIAARDRHITTAGEARRNPVPKPATRRPVASTIRSSRM